MNSILFRIPLRKQNKYRRKFNTRKRVQQQNTHHTITYSFFWVFVGVLVYFGNKIAKKCFIYTGVCGRVITLMNPVKKASWSRVFAGSLTNWSCVRVRVRQCSLCSFVEIRRLRFFFLLLFLLVSLVQFFCETRSLVHKCAAAFSDSIDSWDIFFLFWDDRMQHYDWGRFLAVQRPQ